MTWTSAQQWGHMLCSSLTSSAVRDRRYRIAISKFRLSSHNFEIEWCRHCIPKVPVSERSCFRCNCIEDEQHFLVSCKLYEGLRVDLYGRVSEIIADIYEIGDREKFARLMNSRDNNVLTMAGWFFIYGTECTRWSSYLKSMWYLTELYKAICIYLWLLQTIGRVTWWALCLLILVTTPEMFYNNTI